MDGVGHEREVAALGGFCDAFHRSIGNARQILLLQRVLRAPGFDPDARSHSQRCYWMTVAASSNRIFRLPLNFVALQPAFFGRPRSNGPEIASLTTFFFES
ncbi:unannotated protein [freshwater metagenome]|uniref:Unannotated protein n=1 Tax=freshwater metagenome TaxID=449393 RepID=A0A6J7HFS2_9ZZZZ